MRRVAILTFQHTLNYGAALQCYALQEAVRALGGIPQVLDYRCEAVERSECQSIRLSYPISIAKYFMKHRRRRAFDSFYRHFNLTARCDAETIGDIARGFDVVICGSDQIWNTRITNGDLTYFLPFVEHPTRAASYAASMGNSLLARLDFDDISIARLSPILVRDRATKDAVGRLCSSDADIDIVLDPTLLLTPKAWETVANDGTQTPVRPYVLLYAVSEWEQSCRIASAIARQQGLDLIQICSRRRYQADGAVHLLNASPNQFVNLFRHASATVVSSYHGLCFSLAFGRDFHFVCRDSDEIPARLTGLVDELGIDHRILSTVDDLGKIRPIDQGKLATALAHARRHSLERLADAIGIASSEAASHQAMP